jgi:hypothetical protein
MGRIRDACSKMKALFAVCCWILLNVVLSLSNKYLFQEKVTLLLPLFDAKITPGVPLSISDHHHWNFLYLCGVRNLYLWFQME